MTNLSDSQKFTYGLRALDAKGQPTTLPAGSTVAYASSNEAVAKVSLNADGLSGDVLAQLPGTATISVVVTTPDGKTAGGSDDVTVTSGAETSIALQPGPISEQDAPVVDQTAPAAPPSTPPPTGNGTSGS